jgi:hypothetical protein
LVYSGRLIELTELIDSVLSSKFAINKVFSNFDLLRRLYASLLGVVSNDRPDFLGTRLTGLIIVPLL